jgi:uncharacterized protein YbjT (DUF2867 family)
MRIVVTGATGNVGTSVLGALELLDGIRRSCGVNTPPLEPKAGGPPRVRELPPGNARAAH